MYLITLSSELNVILALSVVILIFGLVLKGLNQPYVIAYILAGVLLGPHGFAFVTEYEVASQLGEMGLIILMFFIGMEISLPNLLKRWKGAFFGTAFQILFSILLTFIISIFFDWSFNRLLLLGFIISLSSSAIVIRLLESYKDPQSKIYQSVLGILITQDILVIPMIICINLLAGDQLDVSKLILQIIGGILIVGLLVFVIKKKTINLPFQKYLEKDHELQLFAAFIACFGFAILASFFELSAGLGALVSGILFGASNSSKWLHESLHAFRVLLVSVFFVSVGMLIDLDFLRIEWIVIAFLVTAVYLSNHGINAVGLKLLGNTWKESIYGGALLAQIGEFSFVLASLGYQQHIISDYGYQITIITIAITIFISPLWVSLTGRMLGNQ